MKKRYSIFLRPISVVIDLIVINLTMFILSSNLYLEISSIVYFNSIWLLISLNTKIYNIYRYSKLTRVVSKLFLHFSFYFLSYFAYFSIFKEGIQIGNQSKTLIVIFSSIFLLKILYVLALRKYRFGGRNYRDVIILGGSQSVESLQTLFTERSYLGYRYKGFFSDKIRHSSKKKYLGSFLDSFEYVLENNIDEIYCSIVDFKRKELNTIIEFGEIHNKTVKLIPSSKGMFRNGMEVEYYDYVPVLSLKKLPFDDPLIKYSKRAFDMLFSLMIIVFILSWLSVLLFIIIKLESKGPLVFRQVRDGLNGSQFECFKFRSMAINKDSDHQMATKGDMRITQVGRFIRKTSIDELPQFINVLKGDMSVVGPRPHMISQSKLYSKKINRYLMRNLVKPGVTGLAQVRGLRGEIEQQIDMENRVRLDIFYINNWSFALDVKIIIQTVFNALKGEEKAY